MISLKKHIEEAPDLLKSIASAYQSSLEAITRAASLTAPQIAPPIEPNFKALNGQLSVKSIAEIDRKVVLELDRWGERASDYFRQKAADVKEILLLVTQTTQTAGDKDERYVSQLTAFSGRLQEIATLDDLSRVRQSLNQSAAELKACADRMSADGKAILSQLQSQVVTYQARLQEAEEQASRDPLTGLENRRGIERTMEDRVARKRAFSVILFDLNKFKVVNDTQGHLAGDELLKQFSAELRARFRNIDIAGRWGGDEFLVVFDGSASQAEAALRKASEWLFGDYKLPSGKVQMTAATGIAEWNGREPFTETLKRADTNMYGQKKGRLTA